MKNFSFIFALMATTIINNNAWAVIASSDSCELSGYYAGQYYYDAGNNCSWSISDDGVLTVKGTGTGAKVPTYAYLIAPWKGYNVKTYVFDNIKSHPIFTNGGTYVTINGGTLRKQSMGNAKIIDCNEDQTECIKQGFITNQNLPVESYTVATATARVNEIGGCEDVKCSLKMWFK